ncbi:MAG TPA: hypothetical protein VFO05_13010 [Candidatus Limnocylindrales bacterium]|nr:hypothetical protein [Candidatus Limnocylindrales bacterium]
MIHEHESTQIASAALDFPLSPAAERELQLELADCPICAERAAAYREQMRMLARLPVIDVSDATRRRITSAALSGRSSDHGSPMFMLLAAALLLGLLLGVTAMAGSLRDDGAQDPLTIVEPSPTPIGPVAAASADGAPSQVPRASSGQAGTLQPDTIAEVVGTNLRARSQPGVGQESIKFEPFLQPGDLLFVMSGPVEADDYDWYEVVPIDAEGSRGAHELPSGWVASADHDGTPWVRPGAAQCPRPPVDIEALESMSQLGRVVCNRGEPVALPAIVQRGDDHGCVGGPCGAEPWIGGWVARSNSVRTPTGAPLEIAIDPASSVDADDIGTDRLVVLHGKFDRPNALGCHTGGPHPAPGLVELAKCRGLLVVDRVEPDPFGLRSGSAATVVTNNLRVRSKPYVGEGSALLEPLLDEGTPLSVIGGPVLASGYTWYEVTVPSQATGDGRFLNGWVAAAKNGQPWIAADVIE